MVVLVDMVGRVIRGRGLVWIRRVLMSLKMMMVSFDYRIELRVGVVRTAD